jgi:hypothetical protein
VAKLLAPGDESAGIQPRPRREALAQAVIDVSAVRIVAMKLEQQGAEAGRAEAIRHDAQGRLLLRHEQDPFAGADGSGNHVGDGLRLSRAGGPSIARS